MISEWEIPIAPTKTKQADAGPDEPLENAVVGDARDDGQAEDRQGEILRRAKQQGDLRDQRSQEQQGKGADKPSDGGGEEGHLQRLEALALHGHRIAVKERGRVGGGAGGIDENGCDGPAIGAAAVNRQQHQNRHGRVHTVGQRDAEDDAKVGGQARNGPHDDADGKPQRNDQEVLPLHQNAQST